MAAGLRATNLQMDTARLRAADQTLHRGRTSRGALALALAVAGCGGGASSTDGGGGASSTDGGGGADGGGIADWAIALDPSQPAGTLAPTLLGQYDLSGALFHYDQQAQLPALMQAAGFTEWRVGLGRWEFATQLLPTLTDGTPCDLSRYPPQAAAPAGTTDLDLLQGRDWFTYADGSPVTIAMTADDNRYRLDYLRSVLDVVDQFGVAPYVDIDHMPRALAANQTPVRTNAEMMGHCGLTWANKVSNVRPADPLVFAAAVVGLVQRTVEGSGGARGRPVRYWEFWNEPEDSYAWDPNVGDFGSWLQTAGATLTALDAYRRQTANADGRAIKIGLGSFGSSDAAVGVLAGFPAPFDFISFHVECCDDPLITASRIQDVVDARATSGHQNAELILSEWTPVLVQGQLDPRTMDVALYDSTVLALGATAGLAHTHHAIFWNFFDRGFPGLGIIDHDLSLQPAYYAYTLFAQVIGSGSSRLAAIGHSDGKLDDGMGAVLASRDAGGKVRVLLVNRNTSARTATVGATPTAVTVLSDPTRVPSAVPPSAVVTVPARSIVLVER